MAIPSLTGWQTESLRVTFFATELVNAQGKNWWSIATGNSPEGTANKLNTSEYSESGVIDGLYLLEMKTTFNRVDWIATPVMNGEMSPPSLGSIENSLNLFIPQILNWLESCDCQWTRLAYGVTGLLPASDVVAANLAIKSYLNDFNLDPNTVKDLVLQVNYPRKSAAFHELHINRISKLMSAAAQFFTIGTTPVPTIKELTFFRLELDLNTSAERVTAIPSDQIKNVISELISSCKEIFESGIKS